MKPTTFSKTTELSLAVFVLLSIADVVSTIYGVVYLGAIELNPIIRYALQYHVLGFILIKTVGVSIVLLLGIDFMYQFPKYHHIFPIYVNAIMLVIVGNNVLALYRYGAL